MILDGTSGALCTHKAASAERGRSHAILRDPRPRGFHRGVVAREAPLDAPPSITRTFAHELAILKTLPCMNFYEKRKPKFLQLCGRYRPAATRRILIELPS